MQTAASPLIAWPAYQLGRDRGERFGRWWLTVWLVLITHALLDAFTIYGTPLWLPLTDYPVGRSIFIIDALYTLLWRVVAVGEDAHWEGFITVGESEPPRLHRYTTDPGLLADIANQWAVRRLQAFTKGFYSVEERDGAVVITDLRMGRAGFYAFAFRLGERTGQGVAPIRSSRFRYQRPPLDTAISELLACGRGEPTRAIAC